MQQRDQGQRRSRRGFKATEKLQMGLMVAHIPLADPSTHLKTALYRATASCLSTWECSLAVGPCSAYSEGGQSPGGASPRKDPQARWDISSWINTSPSFPLCGTIMQTVSHSLPQAPQWARTSVDPNRNLPLIKSLIFSVSFPHFFTVLPGTISQINY